MSEFTVGLVGTIALLIMVFGGVRVFVVAALVGMLGTVAIIGWQAGAGITGTVPHSKSINDAPSVLPISGLQRTSSGTASSGSINAAQYARRWSRATLVGYWRSPGGDGKGGQQKVSD